MSGKDTNMQKETYDVIVVGAGIVGCSVAYHLGKSGLHVALLDKGSVAGEASQAAAGMLAPLGNEEPDHPLQQLGIAAVHYYDGLDKQLKQETGIDIGLIDVPMLRLAFDEQSVVHLETLLTRYQQVLPGLQWLEGSAARESEPLLAENVLGALLSPYERNVQAALVTLAYAHAAVSSSVHVVEGCLVGPLICQGQQVVGVGTTQGPLHAEIVVLAAGAWATQWHRKTPGPPIFPAKGQMMALQATPGVRLRHTVQAYGIGGIVPKADGTIYVGATVEHVGFDRAVTPAGLATLLTALATLTPDLNKARFVRVWSGLRPGSADGLPLIGPSQSLQGLWIAGGHFRDGILLGPLTGHIVAELIQGHSTPFGLPLNAFDPDRFGGWDGAMS